jgi:selenide,water dikinase
MKTNSISSSVKLTEFSHGAGCGCKISPNLLKEILGTNNSRFVDPNLLVGNESSDDAAVFDLGDGRGLISTTDFFMPIVDDPFDFGMIAGSNALSDVYAMGGKPLMAIAIFGWPINKLSADIGARVIEGGREICSRAGITLAGGHSIDSPEPIFGLSVSGIVDIDELKKNTSAQVGDTIFLTKPLGIGVLSTAQKKKVVSNADHIMAVKQMCSLNDIGSKLAKISGVNAVTDVTGFGLAGHLLEVCRGSNVSAEIYFDKLPLLPNILKYIDKGCVPGGTERNFDSYGESICKLSDIEKSIICDPQTSGGLLVTVSKEAMSEFNNLLISNSMNLNQIGKIIKTSDSSESIFLR